MTDHNEIVKYVDESYRKISERENGVEHYRSTEVRKTEINVNQAPISTHPQATNPPPLLQTANVAYDPVFDVQGGCNRRKGVQNIADLWNKFVKSPTRPQNLLLNDTSLTRDEEYFRRKTLVFQHKYKDNYKSELDRQKKTK